MSGLSSTTDATCLLISIRNMYLHPEHTEPRFFSRRIHCRRYPEGEHHARIRRIDDAIIPQPSRTVIGIPLLGVFIQYRLHELALLVGRHRFAMSLELVDFHLKQHTSRLLASHYGNPCARPHPELSRPVSPAAHSIISSAVRAADDDCKLRYGGVRNCIDHFCAIFRNPALFELLSHHKSSNIFQKYQLNVALRAKFDEMCSFQCALRKQNTIVADNADRISPDSCKAADDGRPIQRFEFVKPTRVDDAVDDFANVICLFQIFRNYSVNLLW